MRTPVTSESALHERSKPTPLNTRLRWHQIASISGAGGRRFVPEANLADSTPDEPGLAAPCEKTNYLIFWTSASILSSYSLVVTPSTPHKINMLAHNFNVSNSSSFPSPPCTESAEEPI
jgi:hypothetical protein